MMNNFQNSFRSFLNEEKNALLSRLKLHSPTFVEIWKKLEQMREDETYHKGETVAQHILNVWKNVRELTLQEDFEEQEIFELVAFLHDLGKADAMKELAGRRMFPGHERESVKYAEKILSEISFAGDRSLVLALVAHHMDVLNAINQKNAKFLAKKDIYPILGKLALFAEADLMSIGSLDVQNIPKVVAAAKEYHDKIEEVNKKKEEEKEIKKLQSPEDFIAGLKAKGLPDEAIERAVKGKYPDFQYARDEAIMEGFRSFLAEEILQESAKGLNDLLAWERTTKNKNKSYVVCEPDGESGGIMFSYYINGISTVNDFENHQLIGAVPKRTERPIGYIVINRDKERDGPCLKGWNVRESHTAEGYGPLLYDVAMEWATKNGGGLMSDREMVSRRAKHVWDYYLNKRDDVQKQQLDSKGPPTDVDLRAKPKGQITPRDPTDDCFQGSSLNYTSNWTNSSLSKIYRSNGTPTIDALRAAGKFVERQEKRR